MAKAKPAAAKDKANGGYQALEGGEDQGDAAITGVSPTNPVESQANQEEGVEMPFGAFEKRGRS